MWLLDIRTPAEDKPTWTGLPCSNAAAAAQDRGSRASAGSARRLGIPKHEPVSVYCQRGIRSHIATLLLREMGYTDVTDLGGIDSM